MVRSTAVDDAWSPLHSNGLAWGDFSHTLSGALHFVGSVAVREDGEVRLHEGRSVDGQHRGAHGGVREHLVRGEVGDEPRVGARAARERRDVAGRGEVESVGHREREGSYREREVHILN